MATVPERRAFTVGEYYQMGAAGILAEDDRVELIEGEIIQMPPIGSPHAAAVDRLASLFPTGIGDAAIVRVQGPIHLDDMSEPQPDLALLKPRADFYESAHPGPADTLLAAEVSLTSLAFDRGRKLPLYARLGIPETWIVDMQHGRVEVHRSPSAQGYGSVQVLGRGDFVTPEAFPGLVLSVQAILGAAAT